MFKNIGKKLCGLAKFVAGLGIITAIAGIALLVQVVTDVRGLGVVGASLLISGIVTVISSWPLYAFGQLTEDIHTLRVQTCDQPAPVYTLDDTD